MGVGTRLLGAIPRGVRSTSGLIPSICREHPFPHPATKNVSRHGQMCPEEQGFGEKCFHV